MRKGRVRRQPQRTCIVCRSTLAKRELVRVVRRPDGEVQVDPTGKQAGRGAYLCARRACWDAALVRRAIERALQVSLSPETREEIAAYAAGLPDTQDADRPEVAQAKAERARGDAGSVDDGSATHQDDGLRGMTMLT